MMVTEEWIYWSDDGGSGGLSSLGGRGSSGQTQGGSHPKILRSPGPRPYTKIFYCYYQPKPRLQNDDVLVYLKIHFSAIAVSSVLRFYMTMVVPLTKSFAAY